LNLFFERTPEATRGRPRALWRLISQFLLFQVATVFFAAPLALAWSLFGSVDLGNLSTGTGGSTLFLVGILASSPAALLSVWLVGRFMDRRSFRDFGFHFDGGWWLDLLFGLVLGAILMTGVFLIETTLGWVTVTDSFRSSMPGVPFAFTVALPLGAFLLVGVYEELLSRGYQLRNLAEGLNYPWLGPKRAVLAAWGISSALFGVLHALNPNASLVSIANITLAGLMLGTAYVLTGELAVPIGLHIAWNFFQGSVFGFPVSGLGPIGASFLSTEQAGPEIWTGGVFGPEGGLLVTFATLTGIVLTVLWVRLRQGRATIHETLADYRSWATSSPKK
jgi:membrane protease YdiL (CAAX protease family)